MLPFIKPLLTGESFVAPGRLATIFKADSGLEIHFHRRVIGSIVGMVWDVLITQVVTEKFYIYYKDNIVKFVWDAAVKGVEYTDPYASVRKAMAAKEAAIRKNKQGGWI